MIFSLIYRHPGIETQKNKLKDQILKILKTRICMEKLKPKGPNLKNKFQVLFDGTFLIFFFIKK
jgi:hypothetical protein